MEVFSYSAMLQVVALLSSLMALGFSFNATGSKKTLHGVCFRASLLLVAVSLLVPLLLLQTGVAGNVADALPELLPSGLALASSVAAAMHSFRLMD